MLYFIEKCSLYDYADGNSLSIAVPIAGEVLSNLKHDCEISLCWYRQEGMEANPKKIQFLIFSPYTVENTEPLYETSGYICILIVALLFMTMQ